MMTFKRNSLVGAALLLGATVTLSGCDPNQPPRVHANAYYDSMIWRDYYWPRPPVIIPPGPVHPIEPPIIAPPVVMPPIHIPDIPIPELF